MQTITIAKTIQQLHLAFRANQPVMLWGPPGVGKSDAVRQSAAEYWQQLPDIGAGGAPVIDIRLSQLEPSDLRGIPYPDESGTRTRNLLPEWLPTEPVPFGVIFLDEITSAPHSVAAAAFQLVLDRRLGTYRVPDGWVFVAAGNRLSDRGVVNPMPSPLANRFAHYEVAADVADWSAWAIDAGIDPRIIAYLRAVPASLYGLDVTQGDIRAFPSPRTWAKLSGQLAVGVPADALLLTAAAYVGESAAADFCTVLPVLDQLPTLDEITADPTGCRVPDGNGSVSALSACFGIGNMLSVAVAAASDRAALLDTVYQYLQRLPVPETIPAMMADLMRAIGDAGKAELISSGSAAFRQYALDYSEMLIID